MKVDGTGEEVAHCIVLGSKFSSCVGWVDIKPPINPAGNASLPPIEFATKAANIGMAKPNNTPPKDCDSQANFSKERSKPENFPLLRASMMPISAGILSQL